MNGQVDLTLNDVRYIRAKLLANDLPDVEMLTRLAAMTEELLTKKTYRRKVVFCGVFLSCLLKVLEHERATGSATLRIKDLELDNKEYVRFNDLIRFGFAVRPGEKTGEYTFYVSRVKEFLRGERPVPAFFLRNPNNDDFVLSDTAIYINEVPSIDEVIAVYGPKFTEYTR